MILAPPEKRCFFFAVILPSWNYKISKKRCINAGKYQEWPSVIDTERQKVIFRKNFCFCLLYHQKAGNWGFLWFFLDVADFLISRHRKKFLGFPVLLFLMAGFKADFIFKTTANDDDGDLIFKKILCFCRHAAQMTSKKKEINGITWQ